MIPDGFEVREYQDSVYVNKKPYQTTDIGGQNSFISIQRYGQYYPKETAESRFRSITKDVKTSSIVIDGSTFKRLDGMDTGSYEGDSAGRVMLILFDKSALAAVERPMNQDQNFDPIALTEQIVATMKFSKVTASPFTWMGISLTAPTGWEIVPQLYQSPAQQAAGEPKETVGFFVRKIGAYNDANSQFVITAGGNQSSSQTCADVPQGGPCARYSNDVGLQFPIWSADASSETKAVFTTITNQLSLTGRVEQYSKAPTLFENAFMRITIPGGWSITESYITVTGDKTERIKNGAVNISKEGYILYINPTAMQASGGEGGRFDEGAGGAPGVELVMRDIDRPAGGFECSENVTAIDIGGGFFRRDFYSKASGTYTCHVPTSGNAGWFLSVVSDSSKGWLSDPQTFSSTPLGPNLFGNPERQFVITMTFTASTPDALPRKGAPTLTSMLNEMTGIVRTLAFK
jgi:hypothetical protein